MMDKPIRLLCALAVMAAGSSLAFAANNDTPRSVVTEPTRTLGQRDANNQGDSVQDVNGANSRATSFTQTQSVVCPLPKTGSMTQSRTVTTLGTRVEYGPWVTVFSTCR